MYKENKANTLNVLAQCNLQDAIQHYLLTKNQTPKASTFHGSFTDRWLNLGGKVDIRDMLWHSYVTETNHIRLQILLCTSRLSELRQMEYIIYSQIYSNANLIYY